MEDASLSIGISLERWLGKFAMYIAKIHVENGHEKP